MAIRLEPSAVWLLTLLCWPMAFAEAVRRQEPFVFTSALKFIPKELDSRRVTGVPHYMILQHLVLPLIQFNHDGSVAGALLESWDVAPDFKTFTLNLGDHKFSDGSPIEAADLQATLEANRDAGEGVHFDFRLIKTISSPSKKRVIVVLSEPNQYFLEQVVHPEFGVVPKDEAKKPLYTRSYRVTSGPYTLDKFNEDELLLTRNRFFTGWIETSPEKIRVISDSNPDIKKLVEAGDIGFIQETRASFESVKELIRQGHFTYRPRSAQSIFLTINPDSRNLSSVENRRFVQKVVREAAFPFDKYGSLLERASQLYYRFGASTLNPEEEAQVWTSVDTMKKPSGFPRVISLSAGKGGILRGPLVEQFLKYGVRLNIHSPEVGDPVEKWAMSDMALMNMDFAGKDLLENLNVVFSSAAPVIRVPKSFQLDRMMMEAREAPRGHGRQAIVKKIGRKVLEKGYAAPIMYENMVFVVPSNRDPSRWSKLFYDATWWRMPLKSATGVLK